MNHYTWGITVLSVIGTIANVHQRRWSFWVWLCSNAMWVAYDISIAQYSQAAMFTVYVGLAVWGLVRWGKDTKDADAALGRRIRGMSEGHLTSFSELKRNPDDSVCWPWVFVRINEDGAYMTGRGKTPEEALSNLKVHPVVD